MFETAPKPAAKTKRVVAGLLIRGDQILCCQRTGEQAHPFKWEFPGGKIEAGESPEQALLRELEEELGIRADIGAHVALITHSYAPGTAVELHFFRIEQWRGEIVNRIFNDLRWVSRAMLAELDFLEADLELVRQIAGRRLL